MRSISGLYERAAHATPVILTVRARFRVVVSVRSGVDACLPARLVCGKPTYTVIGYEYDTRYNSRSTSAFLCSRLDVLLIVEFLLRKFHGSEVRNRRATGETVRRHLASALMEYSRMTNTVSYYTLLSTLLKILYRYESAEARYVQYMRNPKKKPSRAKTKK